VPRGLSNGSQRCLGVSDQFRGIIYFTPSGAGRRGPVGVLCDRKAPQTYTKLLGFPATLYPLNACLSKNG
jgi:hypothetical protein